MRHDKDQLVEVTVQVGGYQRNRENEIKRVCMVEWAFRQEDFLHRPAEDGKHRLLEASAAGNLYGDEDVDDIIQRIERAVWRANGGMCHVEVRMMGLKTALQWESSVEEELEIA